MKYEKLYIYHMPIINAVRDAYSKWFGQRMTPSGNVLQRTVASTTTPLPTPPILDQVEVQFKEPYGSIPTHKLGRASGWSQLQNLSTTLDIAKVQAAFRAAERGDTIQLFGFYRDMFLGTGPVAQELSKRKLAVLSEPHTILPASKDEKDIRAAKVIEDMINNTVEWNDHLVHLMNAVLYPVAVAEKIFRPHDPERDGPNPFNIRYRLDKLSPVDYNLLCYRLAYLPSGPINPSNQPVSPAPPLIQSMTGRALDTVYDPDSYEPDLRFWSVFSNGLINFSWSNIYAPDPERHMIYRCNLLTGIARDNFGGLGRSVLMWAILAQQGREFFLRCMDRFGIPFVVAKVDTAQTDTVQFLENAFQLSQKLGALMINKDAEIEIKEIAMAGAAEGHMLFNQFCMDQISLLICGQTLSSHAKGTGMGSGVAKLQSLVRQDLIRYDQLMLGGVLRNQLFKQYLRINGIEGNAPNIVWGGNAPEDQKLLADTIAQLSVGGITPSDKALEDLGLRLGFEIEKLAEAATPNPNVKGLEKSGLRHGLDPELNKQPNEKEGNKEDGKEPDGDEKQ